MTLAIAIALHRRQRVRARVSGGRGAHVLICRWRWQWRLLRRIGRVRTPKAMALPGGLTLTRAPRRGRGDQGRIARYVKPDQHSLWHIAQGTEALGQVELVGRRVGCVRRPPPRRNEVNYVPSLQPNGLEREKVIPQNMLSVDEELLVLRDARRRCDEGLELSHGGCHFDVQLQDGLVPPDDAHRHPARVSRHVSDQPGGAPKVCFIFCFAVVI